MMFGRMVYRTALLASLLVTMVGDVASAQQSSGDAVPKPGFLRALKFDRGGGLLLAKTFGIVFGGIKQGSGAAAGPAVSREFDNGAYVQLKGVYSVRSFKLLQARYDVQPLLGKRLVLSTRVRWQDAPELSLYRLGPDAPNLRAEYSERKTEWSGVARVALAPKIVVLGGTGVERYATDGGWIDRGEDETLNGVPQTPGLGTRPWFLHSFAEIVQDSRLSPDFSRTGRLLDAAVHNYYDGHDGQQSFQRVTLAAYQLVPTWHERGALGFGARAWLSGTGDGHEVPFFLMPTLGGGDYLRGYSSYRFRDRNALLLQAEYRWAVHKMVDVAGLYEAGTVSSTPAGLSLKNMAQSAGGGIRVHTQTSGLLRVDLARGSDGFKVAFGVGIGGS